MNKLENLINVDEPYGEPNFKNQSLFKEAFLIDELIEVIDNIWPDKHYMKRDFKHHT